MRVFYPLMELNCAVFVGIVCGLRMCIIQTIMSLFMFHINWVTVGVDMDHTYMICTPMLAFERRRAIRVGTLKSGKLAWSLHDAQGAPLTRMWLKNSK